MSELPHFVELACRAPVNDRWVLLITFMLTVFADLVLAVNVGVIWPRCCSHEAHGWHSQGKKGCLQPSCSASWPRPQTRAAGVDGIRSIYVLLRRCRNLRAHTAFDRRRCAGCHLRLGRVPLYRCHRNHLARNGQLFKRRGISMLICEVNDVVLAKPTLAGGRNPVQKRRSSPTSLAPSGRAGQARG